MGLPVSSAMNQDLQMGEERENNELRATLLRI